MDAAVVEFGPFRFDRANARLLREGEEITLQPQVLSLLDELVRRPDRLLTYDELMDALWPGTSVTADSLTQAVRKLRKALEDDPKDPLYIETVRRRGYRFIGEVRAGAPGPSTRATLAPDPRPFVGRQGELATLAEACRSHRLVTVVGTGGMGKTRLARRHAVTVSAAGTPVRFCALAECEGAEDVAGVLAAALDLPSGEGQLDRDRVGHALDALGDVLVVLDNCEHVTADVRDAVRSWLARAPRARFLATSRVPLGGAGEVQVRLERLTADDGFALLVARASAVTADFAHTDADAVAIRETVELADGLPLAIELVAGWASTLTPVELAERLAAGRLSLHADGAAEPRHATLDAAIAGSWHMLAPDDRRGLAAAAVFDGGFDADAFAAVTGAGDGALGSLRRLVERSLVFRTTDRPRGRFGVYRPIRRFAMARLSASERAALARSHAAVFAERARVALGDGTLPDRADDFARIGPDQHNFLAATRASVADQPAEAASLALTVLPLVRARSGPDAHRELVAIARSCADRSGDPALQARAHLVAAQLARDRAAFDEALAQCEAVLALVPDGPIALRARVDALLVGLHRGEPIDPANAEALVAEAAQTGDDACEAVATYCLASIHRRDAPDQAERMLDRAVGLSRRAGLVGREAASLISRALSLDRLTRAAEAIRVCEQAVERYRNAGALYGERTALGNLGCLLHGAGRLDEAGETFDRVQALAGSTTAVRNQAFWDACHAMLLAERGELDAARDAMTRAEAGEVNDGNRAPILLRRAVVHALTGELDAAAARAAELVGRDPRDRALSELVGAVITVRDPEATAEARHQAQVLARDVRTGRSAALGYLPTVLARLVLEHRH